MTDQSSPKIQTGLPLLLALVLAAGMFIGQQLPRYDQNVRAWSSGQHAGSNDSALDEILRYVEAKYVDSVNLSDIKKDAITRLLEQLDPHSVYISPEELQHVEEDMSGNFEGIGIEFILVDDTIQVVTPLSGGPSEAAGVLPGDKILTIADTVVAGVKIDNATIFKRLRGAKGTPVKIGIRRGHEKTPRIFNITRDIIPVRSVDIAYMLDEQTGYVKINRFSAPTYQEFMESVRPLVEDKNMKNLVLDLRGNPGGYLNEATDLLSQFFSEGKLLVYTQGRTEERRDYKSNGRARFKLENIAVLIDEGSASASEIVAGAIQDHDRGWVIGRRSYGKGLVQEQYPLSDGGALRLTVSRYYTPSGRSIQRDYKHTEDYTHEADRRLRNGELSDATKIQQADTTKYYTGMGRVVYGGGGVTPDIFVPLDTSFANDYFFAARQLLPQFAARWMEGRSRSSLPTTLDAFMGQFQVSDQMFGEFIDYITKEGTARNDAELAKAKAELRHQLKARVAKILFHDEGLYKVLNDDDPAVEKAMQVMRSGQQVARKS
ncbi:MAG: PDZ domain-containing protein [Saprospiraceae bacterium]|nr:PDZ domain-containing protein [Saprospiraceae bacterium]